MGGYGNRQLGTGSSAGRQMMEGGWPLPEEHSCPTADKTKATPGPVQVKVLMELHQEKVRCAYTHGSTRADMPPASPACITQALPLQTHSSHSDCCTDAVHTHTLTGLFTVPCTTLHTHPKPSESLQRVRCFSFPQAPYAYKTAQLHYHPYTAFQTTTTQPHQPQKQSICSTRNTNHGTNPCLPPHGHS